MKHVRFVYESNFDYLNVWFDSDKMGSILKNILSNALKYTPEEGSVCISACEEGNTWSIEVKRYGNWYSFVRTEEIVQELFLEVVMLSI